MADPNNPNVLLRNLNRDVQMLEKKLCCPKLKIPFRKRRQLTHTICSIMKDMKLVNVGTYAKWIRCTSNRCIDANCPKFHPEFQTRRLCSNNLKCSIHECRMFHSINPDRFLNDGKLHRQCHFDYFEHNTVMCRMIH